MYKGEEEEEEEEEEKKERGEKNHPLEGGRDAEEGRGLSQQAWSPVGLGYPSQRPPFAQGKAATCPGRESGGRP